MAAKTVLNYLPRKSVIHRLTGTTKLAFFLLFTFASMITYNTWVLLGLFAVSIVAFRLSKIKLKEVRFMMVFMLIFLLLNNLFIFLFDPNLDIRSDRHIRTPFLFRHFIHGFDQIAVTDIIQVGIQSFFFEFDDIHLSLIHI